MKSEYKYRVKLSSESSFKIMIQFDMFLPSKINEFEKKNYQTKIYELANIIKYIILGNDTADNCLICRLNKFK